MKFAADKYSKQHMFTVSYVKCVFSSEKAMQNAAQIMSLLLWSLPSSPKRKTINTCFIR